MSLTRFSFSFRLYGDDVMHSADSVFLVLTLGVTILGRGDRFCNTSLTVLCVRCCGVEDAAAAGDNATGCAPKAAGAPRVAGAPKATGVPRAAGAPRATGAQRAAGAPRDTGTPRAAGGPRVTGAQRAAGAPRATGTPRAVEALGQREPRWPRVPRAAGAPRAAGTPRAAGVPRTAGVPMAAGGPNATGTLRAAGAPRAAGARGRGYSVNSAAAKSLSGKIASWNGHSPHDLNPLIALSCVDVRPNAVPKMPAIW